MEDVRAKALKEWQEARFGMFIHWGAYSVGGLDCIKMQDMGVPVQEYVNRFAKKFNPTKYDANEFARVAKDGGAKYVVMGSRHHDGFCLWNTKTTKYSSVNMKPKRDFIAEYVEAIRGAGLKVGLYYSMLDWRYKGYWEGPHNNPASWQKLVALVHEQVRELMTNYGKIDILWYDGGWRPWGFEWQWNPSHEELWKVWRANELNEMVRKLQPHILMNNRCCDDNSTGDFGTPEQQLKPEERPWEMCDNMGYLWGYAPQDKYRKDPRRILITLVTCVQYGGNLLLNIGPKPDGSVQKWQARTMKLIGTWLKKHGEAIYGCGKEVHMPLHESLSPWQTTRKSDTLYMHLVNYPGTEYSVGTIHNYYFISAELLTTGKKLEIIHEPTRDIIRGLPAKSPDPMFPVVKIKFRERTQEEIKAKRWIGLDNPETEVNY